MLPKFSVIIPTYNRAAFIAKSVQSVLDQTYLHFEVIIVDDGSTDDTENIVKNIESDKVRYFKQANGERAKARNFGVKNASGDYVTFLDSDDLLYPIFLEEAQKLTSKHKEGKFFHLAYEMKTPDGKVLSQVNQRVGNLNLQLVKGNSLSCIGVLLKREVALQHPFNEDRALSGTEDWELWIRLASRFPIFYSNRIVATMINHEHRSVLNIDEESIRKRIDLAMQYTFEDEAVKSFYGKYYPIMYAHLYLYISLHLVLSKKKKRGWLYWWKAFRYLPNVLFTRKTLAIIKHTLK